MAAYTTDLAPEPPIGPPATELGGKARSLARLAGLGFPTPPAFVITDALFRALRAGGPPLPASLDDGERALAALERAAGALETAPWPDGFEDELGRRLAALGGGRFSVRSSFVTEDRPEALAAGVYQSRVDVTAGEVPAAVRAVLRSALSPAALAYALAHRQSPAAPPVAVLVHPFVPADAAGAAAREGTAELIHAGDGQPSPAARAAVEQALRVLAARLGGVEVEWAARGDQVTFLQLRPYRAPPPPAPWPHDPGPPWRWDAAHNPLPLSAAQAGLVALVDERCRIGLRQRVVAGYLFTAPGEPAPSAIRPEEAPAALAALRTEAERALAALGPHPDLEAALALFVAVYGTLFGVIQPAARAARQALVAAVERTEELAPLLAGVQSMASERRRRAARLASAGEADRAAALDAYLQLFGDEAPVWDVAVPTYREAPGTLRPPARGEPAAPPPPRGPDAALVAAARAAVAVGEDDDWLYARVQAAVRRALLVAGERLRARGLLETAADVFHWPLPVTRAVAAGGPPPADPRGLVHGGRAALEEARRAPPPGAADPGAAEIVLRGCGTGGRALGRVWLHGQTPAPPDAILVASTLLPTELPLVGAAALVTETGGPLDHVATQARERGLPAVVGVPGATRRLADGELVLVDADRGLVIKLAGSS
jgi:phosphohistidine swiveling domain-containing protein